MKQKDLNQPICAVCGEPILKEKPFIFEFNEKTLFFCDIHATAVKLGISLGQSGINSSFLAFLTGLEDPITKNDIKRAAMELSPMTNMKPAIEGDEEEIEDLHFNFETPAQFYKELEKVVIGQESAKKSVSVAVINHLQSLEDDGPTSHSDKHHVLMLGKSGSGKTLIANTVADLLQLPFVAGDATSYSPTGFQGADAESMIYDLLLDNDMNFTLVERGIVFIDEIDKICGNSSDTHRYESFLKATQPVLLKLIEGKIVKVPGHLYGDPPGSSANVDTSRMLFFLGGAFNGLADILAKKMGSKERSLGFRKPADDKTKEIDEALKSYEIFSKASREEMIEALIEFGMISELIGRIPTIVPLKPLDKIDLMRVLLESTTSPVLKQQNIFAKSGYNLVFSDEFLNKIVEKSYLSSTGTRALDSYVKKAVSLASFDLLTLSRTKINRGSVIINEACIEDPSLYEKVGIQNTGTFPVALGATSF